MLWQNSDLSFSWKDVLSKSTRFAGIRQVKTRFQMLYFTEAVETAPRNITQTKKTPIRSIALAIMTEKPKKLELQTLSCVWNPRKSYDQFGSMPQFWKKRWRHDSIVLLKTTHEQPPRLGRGKHETLNLVMARCREGAGYCRGSFFSL